MFYPTLYHITRQTNLESILEYGLGALCGEGINMEKGRSGNVFTIYLDPMPYIQGYQPQTDTEREQRYIVFLICKLLMYRDEFADLTVITINANKLDQRLIERDPNPHDRLVCIYQGIISPLVFKYQNIRVCKTDLYE